MTLLPVPAEMTAVVGATLTAAEWNANVRDAVNFLTALPLFAASQSATQSVPTAAYTAVSLDTETIDSYAGHSNTTNNSRYTAQVAGYYLCVGSLGFGTTTGRIGGYWSSSNGRGGGSATAVFSPASSNGFVSVTLTQILQLNVGDYVQMNAYQNSGAAANIGNVSCEILWVHA